MSSHLILLSNTQLNEIIFPVDNLIKFLRKAKCTNIEKFSRIRSFETSRPDKSQALISPFYYEVITRSYVSEVDHSGDEVSFEI